MKIDTETGQGELERLYSGAIRREVLKSSPLNLRMFLRYALLFMLFPGMVMGYKVGMLMTLLFCGVLVGILMMGTEGAATLAMWIWLGLGMGVVLWVHAGVLMKAVRDGRRRKQFRVAQVGLKHAVRQPERYHLKWHSLGTDHLVAQMVLQAPKRGVYAVLLHIDGYDGRRITTGGVEGTCVVTSHGAVGKVFDALILYRLEAGLHELKWAVPDGRSKHPQAEVTQLNVVE